jgi:hypothetical protein
VGHGIARALRRPIPHTVLECQGSELINSVTRPTPTTARSRVVALNHRSSTLHRVLGFFVRFC